MTKLTRGAKAPLVSWCVIPRFTRDHITKLKYISKICKNYYYYGTIWLCVYK